MEKQSAIAAKESTTRAAAEDIIARIAPAREERIFLVLSIFIGVISGLLVVSFRMAIEWLSVLLLGSSPQPHQPRLIFIPALAGLVIALFARFVFKNQTALARSELMRRTTIGGIAVGTVPIEVEDVIVAGMRVKVST